MTAVHLCQYRRHEDLLEEASIEGWHLNNVVWASKASIEELLREIPPSPFEIRQFMKERHFRFSF